MSNGTKFKDIFVAVHGIGKQNRYETVRSVANQLADSPALRGDHKIFPVAPQPLGYFHGDIPIHTEVITHSDVKSFTSVCLLDDAGCLKNADLASIGFAEVFWADIPQEVVKEGRTLEETKAWARTVVARANTLCMNAAALGKEWIVPPDFSLAGEVLDEIITTVYVLENLFFLANKAGVFKFELKDVLAEYLGDVQLVAEFSLYRADIVGRFHQAMENIYEEQCRQGNPDVRIHIVSHSEGTVVSFLGLLHAMSEQRLIPSDPAKQTDAELIEPSPIPEWLKHVRGYMTIGSPIDKHILLWQRLWNNLHPKTANNLFRDARIRWRNYYDYGDPVGFKLDSARLWLEHMKCDAFEFCGCPECHHDMGFARYLFPGEAHNEYWKDSAVFEHFIRDVVKPPPDGTRPVPPPSRKIVRVISPTLPYLLSFLILFLGVFILYKAAYAYKHPGYDPLQKVVRFMQLGVQPPADQPGWQVMRVVFGIAGLIAGATLLARISRLALGHSIKMPKSGPMKEMARHSPRFITNPTWPIIGVLAFLAGCGLYYCMVPADVRHEIGGRFYYLGKRGPTLGIMGLAALAGMSGYLANTRPGKLGRQQRWFLRGTRPLIFCGALMVAVILIVDLFFKPYVSRQVPAEERSGYTTNELHNINEIRGQLGTNDISIIQEAHLSPTELNQIILSDGTNWVKAVTKVLPVLATKPPFWPVVVAGLAFLYLWWLAMLLFDLAFVWQRYIRNSVTNDRLREWNPYRFSKRWERGKTEPHRGPRMGGATQ